MSLLSAVSVKPFSAANLIPKLKLIPRQNRVSVSSVEFGRLRSVSCARLSQNRKTLMAGLIGVRVSNGQQQDVESFEQEVLIGSPLDSGAAAGLEATLNTLSKWIMSFLFGAIVLLRHDAESSWAVMGSIFNAMLSVALKKILNQERPFATQRSDPGMPSSHAQSIFFIVAFVSVSLVEWLGINGLTATLSGLSIIAGSYFTWLRVSQKLHTISQVVVGAVIGSIFSMLWFWSWNTFVLGLFESYLWVRILVLLGSAAFCVAFLGHVYKSWIKNDR